MDIVDKKIGFIFPGQGCQTVGMGKDFYENYDVSREIYDMAEEISKINIKKLCFQENEEIKLTQNMQICIFTTCVAILRAVQKEGLASSINAGLSLGEYTALAASDVINLEDIIRTVKNRGLYMQEAYRGESSMVAITSRNIDLIESACRISNGIVSIANYNGPMQTVITGEKSAVDSAVEYLVKNGIKNIVRLNVSGPFHCELMDSAKTKLSDFLENIVVNDFSIPYISNVSAEIVYDKKQVKDLLVRQVVSPVKWHQSVRVMIENGAECFVEIGPGNSLTNLVRSIDRNVRKISISKINDLYSLL
ncbi:[acyl-carrier-protein] S-malonyltransferase [Enterocloster clostridioformis]|nr:ACP S-malonyltransferase [Enterocloster clostridioformis]ANU49725.1 [acyl-carrier-protein] S-malonyltransferase [Lachnoclostridium sp. YL32]NDO28824.1 ACP S-malonyltransferase [Enterocloster clostridioformis]OXE71223.1 [acyl-carrier-protein] S-malonyltransferase [Enterocloster clostridioformis]QQR01366.1 ACP S-malonyltransferase [Enterocloster clostridioformis]